MGMANAAMQLGRYVAAEVHPPAERARAIGRVVTGGTVGAVIGPLLVGPSAGLAARLRPHRSLGAVRGQRAPVRRRRGADRVPAPTGAAGARAAGRGRARARRMAASRRATRLEILRDPQVRVGRAVAGGGAGGDGDGHGHHVAAHDAPRPRALERLVRDLAARGRHVRVLARCPAGLADRWGRPATVALGAVVLVLACALAPLSPRVVPLAGALFALGLGLEPLLRRRIRMARGPPDHRRARVPSRAPRTRWSASPLPSPAWAAASCSPRSVTASWPPSRRLPLAPRCR